MELLSKDAFHPLLKTHKLKGNLKDSWACSASLGLRIIFKFVQDNGPEAILLETIGTHDDTFSGGNVENATLTLTTHAEGNALTAAVAAGEKSFKALLVLTDGDPPPFPCAICRQSLAEFDRGEMLILAANTEGSIRETRLSDLYPESFGPDKLI